MARIRSIKPEFFKHEQLFDAEKEAGLPLRVAFAGLWCVADREGRFRWRPRTLKSDILPFDDVDFTAVLDALAQYNFIVPYEVGEEKYGHIPSFNQHQHVNLREAASALPAPGTCVHVQAHGEGEREREGGNPSTQFESNGASAPNGAAHDRPIVDLDAAYFRFAVSVLGEKNRPLAARLKKAKGVDEALRVIERARTREDALSYVAAACSHREPERKWVGL